MRIYLFNTLIFAICALVYGPIFAAEKPSAINFRCGNAQLTEKNRALWPVLGEWEGPSGSGKNILLHQVGCDGRMIAFKRPAVGTNQHFKRTLSSYYQFVHAPNPYVINVSTPEDSKHPDKQVAMFIRNNNIMTFNIEFFYPFELSRTTREICMQAASAIKQSADIAVMPEYYFPKYSQLIKEEKALEQVFRAIKKRDSWRKAQQKISDALEKALSGHYAIDLESGDYFKDPLVSSPLDCLKIKRTNLPSCIAYGINSGSHLLAYSLVAMAAAESDDYIRTLLIAPGTPNLKLFIKRWGGMLNEIQRIQDYYWEHIQILRANQCRNKYGQNGSYPNSTTFRNVPYAPIEVEQYLPAPSATKDEHMANSISALIAFSKQYQVYQ